jgi:hypothetical protein
MKEEKHNGFIPRSSCHAPRFERDFEAKRQPQAAARQVCLGKRSLSRSTLMARCFRGIKSVTTLEVEPFGYLCLTALIPFTKMVLEAVPLVVSDVLLGA